MRLEGAARGKESPALSRCSQLVERRPIVALHVPLFTPKLLDVIPNLAPPDMVEERAVDDRILAQVVAGNAPCRLASLCHGALAALLPPLVRRDAEGAILVDPSLLREARAVRRLDVPPELLLVCVVTLGPSTLDEPVVARLHTRSHRSRVGGWATVHVSASHFATGKNDSKNGDRDDSNDIRNLARSCPLLGPS